MSTVSETKQALDEVKSFNPEDLVRTGELGAHAFNEAVEPATVVLELYKRLPTDMMSEIPQQQRGQIKACADATSGLFEEFLNFDLEAGDNSNRKKQHLDKLEKEYQRVWAILQQFISYGVARTVDFNRLDAEARAALKQVERTRTQIEERLASTTEEAERILRDVRKVAEEQGVTQQAIYFQSQADTHKTAARSWLIASIVSGTVLTAYAVFALAFPHVISGPPTSTLSLVQALTSKALLLAVLSAVVFSVVRNYRSHKHNEVVNRHRQNALLTYKSLTDAGGTSEAREAVLSHAAAAIYAPVDSGYVSSEERGYSQAPATIAISPRPSTAPAE